MCGRYQRRSDKQRIAEAFALGNVDGLALELAPDYNVAPQTMQPVIVWDEELGMRTLQMMFWRFLPPFVSDPKKFRLDTINAKARHCSTAGRGAMHFSAAAVLFRSTRSSSGSAWTRRRSCRGSSE